MVQTPRERPRYVWQRYVRGFSRQVDSETLTKYYLTSRATRYYMGHRGLPATTHRIFFVSQHLIYNVNSARGYTSLERIPCVNLGTHNLPNSFPPEILFWPWQRKCHETLPSKSRWQAKTSRDQNITKIKFTKFKRNFKFIKLKKNFSSS